MLGSVEGAEADADPAGEDREGSHDLELCGGEIMEGGTGTRREGNDEGAGGHHEQQCYASEDEPDDGGDGFDKGGGITFVSLFEDADHGAVEGAVDATQEDEDKPWQDVGDGEGAVFDTRTKGLGHEQLAHHAEDFAECRRDRDRTGHPQQGFDHRSPQPTQKVEPRPDLLIMRLGFACPEMSWLNLWGSVLRLRLA